MSLSNLYSFVYIFFMPLIKEPARSNQRLFSHEDVDCYSRKQNSADESEQSDPWSSRTVPRRHTVGGPRTAGDVIVMQSYDMDHKKEAFLEHLKQKYPHHASVIMGHQERIRDQVSSEIFTSVIGKDSFLLKLNWVFTFKSKITMATSKADGSISL